MGRKTTLRGSASLYVCPSVSDMNRKYTRSLVTCDCEWLFAKTGSSHRRQLGKVAFMGSPSLPSGSHPPTAAYYRARQDAGAPLDLTLRHCLCCKGWSGAESTIHCCSWKLAISYLLHRPACTVQCTIETLLCYVLSCTSLLIFNSICNKLLKTNLLLL